MGFCVGMVELIQHRLAIWIAGVKGMGLHIGLQCFRNGFQVQHLQKCFGDVTLGYQELQLSLVPNILASERLFAKTLSQLNEPRNLRMRDFVVTEQRGTLLPSDVM